MVPHGSGSPDIQINRSTRSDLRGLRPLHGSLQPGGLIGVWLLLVGSLAPPTASPALALERVVRTYDERDGLTVAETCELAQDSRGFLWIGTIGGVTRFDGGEMRPWAPNKVRHVIKVLTTGPDGEVVVAGATEPLWRITPTEVEAMAGPHGGEIRDWVHAALTDDGALWVATADTLYRRAPNQSWQP